jgi:hypothetical protein
MSARRVVAALLAMMLCAAVISVLPGSLWASAAPGDGPPSDSEMTLSGNPDGPFKELKVTVSQTKNLINQVVTVGWTGGTPTVGAFAINFLQIMQCWGDDPAGPERTQCQFGAANSGREGLVASRQLDFGTFDDPKEKLVVPGTPKNGTIFVPFWPVSQKDKPTETAASNRNDFFDSQVTNEIPLARTHGDSTGLQYFEVQTVRQAAGLGCGEPIAAGAATGRKCWLVVVPRGNTEVDGKTKSGFGALGRVDSSPLSQSNWDNRIVFPMEFLPATDACPVGAPERRMVGHELATDAISRWQPALCAGGGALYSYTQLPDDVARNQVMDGSSPGLALVTDPIPPDQAPPDRPLVYAPVGLSGLAIAFNIEHQPGATAPPEQLALDGDRFTSMKLTPRLVAKLLTQSYRRAVTIYTDPPEYLKNNPEGLTKDPEFLELNPEYANFSQYNSPPDALVQLPGSDITSLLWSWVKDDPDASAFLAGTPDKNGMVVNPNNKGLDLPTSTFSRNDQSCFDKNDGTSSVTLKYCTLDLHPFTNDMHDAGLSASRGDGKEQFPVADISDSRGWSLTKQGRQLPNQRGLIAVVDAATAVRYGLPTAELLNGAHKFVPLDNASLLAGAAAMKPSPVPGVLASDPSAADPAAYPLTALSYAVTSPSTLDAPAGKDYAAFLRYAAGDGQQPGVAPGRLPLGMAPLPDTLKAQTAAAAATIEAQAGKASGAIPEPQQPPPGTDPGAAPGEDTTAPTGDSNTTSTDGTATPGGGVGAPVPPATTPNSNGSITKPPTAALQPAGVRGRTPSLPAPAWVGGVLLVTLICGALAATSSPALKSSVIDRIRAVLRRARKGVVPRVR